MANTRNIPIIKAKLGKNLLKSLCINQKNLKIIKHNIGRKGVINKALVLNKISTKNSIVIEIHDKTHELKVSLAASPVIFIDSDNRILSTASMKFAPRHPSLKIILVTLPLNHDRTLFRDVERLTRPIVRKIGLIIIGLQFMLLRSHINLIPSTVILKSKLYNTIPTITNQHRRVRRNES